MGVRWVVVAEDTYLLSYSVGRRGWEGGMNLHEDGSLA